MIINIRGTSGSGKSSLVRALMEYDGAAQPVFSLDHKVTDYRLLGKVSGQTAVVGRYDTACGGCDGIRTQDEVCARVREFAHRGYNVVFEGLLISHIYGRYRDLHRELEAAGHGPYVWLFLDTPLEVCLANVRKRREARGNTKPLNEQNTIQKWHDARRVFQKAQDDNLKPLWLPYANGVTDILTLLRTEALV